MRRQALDVIQVDYAMDIRNAAERMLPLAQERGVAVMINLPFGRGRLFQPRAASPPRMGARAQRHQLGADFPEIHRLASITPIAVPGMAQARYLDDNLAAAGRRSPMRRSAPHGGAISTSL